MAKSQKDVERVAAGAPFFDLLNLFQFNYFNISKLESVSVNIRKLPPGLVLLPGECQSEVLNVTVDETLHLSHPRVKKMTKPKTKYPAGLA